MVSIIITSTHPEISPITVTLDEIQLEGAYWHEEEFIGYEPGVYYVTMYCDDELVYKGFIEL